jgi:LysM repeat protein
MVLDRIAQIALIFFGALVLVLLVLGLAVSCRETGAGSNPTVTSIADSATLTSGTGVPATIDGGIATATADPFATATTDGSAPTADPFATATTDGSAPTADPFATATTDGSAPTADPFATATTDGSAPTVDPFATATTDGSAPTVDPVGTVLPGTSIPGATVDPLATPTLASIATATTDPAATAAPVATVTIDPGATTVPGATASATPPSGMVPGATARHAVSRGEWVLQIARCYGVSYGSVLWANYLPNPDYILPGWILTIPDIGREGRIVGPPCVIDYTVAAGDTWDSLAARHQTTTAILQKANPGALVVGRSIWVPRVP